MDVGIKGGVAIVDVRWEFFLLPGKMRLGVGVGPEGGGGGGGGGGELHNK